MELLSDPFFWSLTLGGMWLLVHVTRRHRSEMKNKSISQTPAIDQTTKQADRISGLQARSGSRIKA